MKGRKEEIDDDEVTSNSLKDNFPKATTFGKEFLHPKNPLSQDEKKVKRKSTSVQENSENA